MAAKRPFFRSFFEEAALPASVLGPPPWAVFICGDGDMWFVLSGGVPRLRIACVGWAGGGGWL